ncbi:MAG: hypothetical protein HKN73_03740 [Gemmatimonadetes bacterium]|nr:hypothetical protein [Gemmatimonadota bacterium]
MRNVLSLGVSMMVAAGVVTLSPSEAEAQVGTASVSALGVADSYGTLARGYAAPGANPALLGLDGNPFFSLAIPTVRASQGLSPISLGDLNRYSGQYIPTEQKTAWLDEIDRIGSFQGGGQAQASALALNVGPVAFQHSTYAVLDAHLNPDAAELLLFGNSGRSGSARDFVLDGSQLDASVFSSFALALGMPVSLTDSRQIAVGATLSYTVGHGVLAARDMGSMVQSDPVSVDLEFPVLHTGENAGLSQGSGIGMDVGIALDTERYSLSFAAKNVFNTFEWDTESMEYRPGEALFDGSEGTSDFDPQPAEAAPAELLAALADQGFDPVLQLSGSYRLDTGTTLVAETRSRLGDGIAVTPKFHLGVGAEHELAGWFAVRTGLAAITDGYRLGGGGTFILGPVNVTGGWLYQGGDVGAGHHLGFGLSFNQR